MHAIYKHEKKNYSCENIQRKGPKKMIWPPFLEVAPNGTTQGWVQPVVSLQCNVNNVQLAIWTWRLGNMDSTTQQCVAGKMVK
jgi:hypothetical protein